MIIYMAIRIALYWLSNATHDESHWSAKVISVITLQAYYKQTEPAYKLFFLYTTTTKLKTS